MKKSKTLRLHRQHDLDLITLYRAAGFSFSKEVRNILVAYVNHEPYDSPEIDYEDVDLSYIPTTIQYHLALNPSDPKEQAVLDMLHDEIKYGYMNAFVKALIRAYIPRIPFIGYGVANGFITRQITATDVSRKMRDLQRQGQDAVKADIFTANNVTSIVSASIPAEPVSVMAASMEETSKIKPEEIEQKSLESERIQEQSQMIPDKSEYDEEIDDSDEDDFDDFFKAAQSFTGV